MEINQQTVIIFKEQTHFHSEGFLPMAKQRRRRVASITHRESFIFEIISTHAGIDHLSRVTDGIARRHEVAEMTFTTSDGASHRFDLIFPYNYCKCSNQATARLVLR